MLPLCCFTTDKNRARKGQKRAEKGEKRKKDKKGWKGEKRARKEQKGAKKSEKRTKKGKKGQEKNKKRAKKGRGQWIFSYIRRIKERSSQVAGFIEIYNPKLKTYMKIKFRLLWGQIDKALNIRVQTYNHSQIVILLNGLSSFSTSKYPPFKIHKHSLWDG